MKNWVILFVRTGSEEKWVRILKERLITNKYLPFLPVKETHCLNNGTIYKVSKLLFQGYVFIQTEIETDSIAEKLNLALVDIVRHKDIYSIFHYGDDKKK